MDNDVILKKIESLNKCVSRIETKVPLSVEELKDNIDLQDIISVNLERAVQISVDIASIVLSEIDVEIPATMAETFTALAKAAVLSSELSDKLSKAVGFRNIAVHEYDKINWEIVYSICTKDLNDFKKYTARVIEYYNL